MYAYVFETVKFNLIVTDEVFSATLLDPYFHLKWAETVPLQYLRYLHRVRYKCIEWYTFNGLFNWLYGVTVKTFKYL